MAITNIFGVPHYYQLTTEERSPVVVFIHGWLLSHKYWQPIIEQLSFHHQCLAYDLRGFGESRYGLEGYRPGLPEAAVALGGSTSPYGLSAYARDLAALLGQLNLGPVWLVGHSLGGSVALWMAHCFPDRVQGVVCLNSGGGIYLAREFQQFRRAGQYIVGWRQSWLRHTLLPLLLTRMMVHRPLAYQWGRDRCLDLLDADAEAALGSLLESTTEAEVHLLPRLVASLHQPIYFVAGCQDQVMDRRYVHHLASYLPKACQRLGPVIEIEDCGHLAMLEQPDIVTKLLQDVLVSSSQTVSRV
ncbi:alpha/beta hydrolase [Nodosilinea sp. LEGE 07088]|uniref:alpha/beta fold hydrolase n=1 Tax=Nodosilinea sp. LEGE 07088 TaxID=2777968 RepID=UPI00188240D9|nr:alpha/beta hydrolase [Nodosilinea sp. LEGE 07088]MBE9137958.1 alpha/beta hydrolase [Nodosilinea sp. LEGE 07088]